MLRPPFARRFPRRGLAVLVGCFMIGNAQAADLWTIAQDALANGAQFSSTQANFQATEAARDAQRGTLLPQISLGGNAAHSRVYNSTDSLAQGQLGGEASAGLADRDDVVNSIGLNLDAEQAIYAPSLRAQLERARREVDQDALSVDVARQQLLYDVASAYFEILRAHDILSARRAQEAAISRQLEQARERFEVGLVAITDVHEAQASYDLARAQRIAAEGAMQVSFEALERLTGNRYESIEPLEEEVPITPPEPVNRAEWVDMALVNSPMLLMAEAGIEVARSSVDVARAGNQPEVSAFASYGWSDSDRAATEYQSESQVGLRASLPLYSGGTTRAQIRQSGFLLEASQYDFEAQRRETVQQVRSAFTLANNNVETVEARRQAIVSNRSALEATLSGYEVGTRNIVDVLNAERNLFNAIAEHAEARYDYVLSLLQLQQQAGVLGLDSIQAVNTWLAEDESVSLELPEVSNDDAVMNIGERPRAPS